MSDNVIKRVRVKALAIIKEENHHLTGDVVETRWVHPPADLNGFNMLKVKLDRNPMGKEFLNLPESIFEYIGEIKL